MRYEIRENILGNQPCDLSGILEEQPNGKFDFGDYKERFQTFSIF